MELYQANCKFKDFQKIILRCNLNQQGVKKELSHWPKDFWKTIAEASHHLFIHKININSIYKCQRIMFMTLKSLIRLDKHRSPRVSCCKVSIKTSSLFFRICFYKINFMIRIFKVKYRKEDKWMAHFKLTLGKIHWKIFRIGK